MTYRRRYELAIQFLTDKNLNKEFNDYCFEAREKKRRKKSLGEQPLHGKILLKAIDVAIGNSSLDSGEVRILQIIRWLISRGIFDADVKWCDRCELWKPPTHSCFIQDKDEPKKEQKTGRKVLCAGCGKPIKIDELGMITNKGFYHKKITCVFKEIKADVKAGEE